MSSNIDHICCTPDNSDKTFQNYRDDLHTMDRNGHTFWLSNSHQIVINIFSGVLRHVYPQIHPFQ